MNSNISTYTPFAHENRWKQSSIYIKLPCENVFQEEGTAHMLEVPGVYHQSLVEVVMMAFQDGAAKTFHFTPFSLYWQPTPESPPEQVYSEFSTQTPSLKKTRRSEDFRQNLGLKMNMLWLCSWSHLTQHILDSLDVLPFGQSTCSLAISQSMTVQNHLNLLLNMASGARLSFVYCFICFY